MWRRRSENGLGKLASHKVVLRRRRKRKRWNRAERKEEKTVEYGNWEEPKRRD